MTKQKSSDETKKGETEEITMEIHCTKVETEGKGNTGDKKNNQKAKKKTAVVNYKWTEFTKGHKVAGCKKHLTI